MFFENWADRIGTNEIKYSVIDTVDTNIPSKSDVVREVIKVDFENEEDATVMLLKGIPSEFKKYLRFTD